MLQSASRPDISETGLSSDGVRVCVCVRARALTWLMWTAATCVTQTEEWLGELGSDLHGPMDSCCFFLLATIFWATVTHKARNDLIHGEQRLFHGDC